MAPSFDVSSYDWVVYLRPDVVFFEDFYLDESVASDAIGVPDFHSWGGLNDRFAYGRPGVMALYGRRMRYLATFFQRHPGLSIHAEHYLATYLTDHSIRSVLLRLRFGRVRAHGRLTALDQELWQQVEADRRAAQLAAATPSDVPSVLHDLLVDYRRYAETQWHVAAIDSSMGYHGSGLANGGNEGPRSQSIKALVYALLARRGDATFSTRDRVDPALKYSASVHLTGTARGVKNDTWGGSWQSAMYAGNLGFAALIIQLSAEDPLRRPRVEPLSAETLAAVRTCVAYEADRFIDRRPPGMQPGDTKSEEIAWDLTAPAAAELLMPTHPHAAAWHQAVVKHAFNVVSRSGDEDGSEWFDGRPLSDWIVTRQIFDDWSMENHHIFHPVYAMVGPATNGQVAAMYTLMGRPVPAGLHFNIRQQWHECLQYIALPDGEWIYPQGLDWDLHDYEHIHYYSMLATQFDVPAAVVLEARTVHFARRRQLVNRDGRLVGRSSSLGFAREAVAAERIAFAAIMHENKQTDADAAAEAAPAPVTGSASTGAVPVAAAAAAASSSSSSSLPASLLPSSGGRHFPSVGVTVHRTARGLVSFSTKNKLCGQLAPSSVDHMADPYVTTPHSRNLVGHFVVHGQPSDFEVRTQSVQLNHTDMVSVAVDLLSNGGQLRQQIAWISLEPGLIVYMDRVTAVGESVTVTGAENLPLSIENDDLTAAGGRILSSAASGPLRAHSGSGSVLELAGPWISVDHRLALILPNDTRVRYRCAKGAFNRPGAAEDVLSVDSATPFPHTFTRGQLVAQRTAVIMLNPSREEITQMAAHAVFTRQSQSMTVRLPQITATMDNNGTM